MHGVVNVSAPNPLPNRQFMSAIREAWGIGSGLPATEWMLAVGAFFMRTETELLLKSRRVVPGRLLDRGFSFDFPRWPAAAKRLVEAWRADCRNREGTALVTHFEQKNS
jgi:NAD dependent epimerase/dehydratase family enzyme